MDGDPIDLRSDVVAPPTEAMWAAMRRATPDWPPEADPAVRELEALGAARLGKPAAVLLPTCGAANLLALLVLGRRGSPVVLEASAHIVTSEGWGVSAVAGLVPRLVAGRRGAPDPAAIVAAITDGAADGGAGASLVCLENTHTAAGGAVLTPAQTVAVAEVARRHGAAVHLDGARLANAAVALAELAEPADTVAFSLNKGLAAPYGAVLAGPAATIATARTEARRLGLASVHKAGVFAAAGLVALTTMIDRLADDHRRAAALADRLAGIPGFRVEPGAAQTNIVLAEVTAAGVLPAALVERLAGRGVLALARPPAGVRFVTHHAIDDAAVERAATAVAATLSELGDGRTSPPVPLSCRAGEGEPNPALTLNPPGTRPVGRDA